METITIQISKDDMDLLNAFCEVEHPDKTIQMEVETFVSLKLRRAMKLASKMGVDVDEGILKLKSVATEKKAKDKSVDE